MTGTSLTRERAGRGGAWRTFFGHPEYVRFQQQILTPEVTAAQVEWLRRLLDLRPGARVLDLGCGYGRISLPLARAGCRVTGVDASAALLERARREAAGEGLQVEYVEQDLRDLDRAAAFDAALSFSTAIGYVEDDAGDRAALGNAARALVPGGQLLVDIENRERMLGTAGRTWRPMDGVPVLSQASFDAVSGRWREQISWPDGCGGMATVAYSLRLYSATELRAMVEEAGAVVDAVLGHYDGSAYELGSPRLIVVAHRAP